MKRIILSITLILSVFLVKAQEYQGLSPVDIARLQMVTSASISEDGQKIAYSVSVPADPTVENKSASYELYLYDLAKGTGVPFVTQGYIRQIEFRPGSGSITFLSKRDEDKAVSLYEISLAGGEARRILGFGTSISKYAWSPDGQKVAFIARESKSSGSFLPYQPEIYEENLAFSRAYVVALGSGSPEMIPAEGNFHTVEWSPDGSKLAIATAPSPLVDDAYTSQKIEVIDAGSFNTISTIDHEGKLGDIAWSTDGKKLGFIGGADKHDPIDGRLFVAQVKSGESSNIYPDFEGKFEGLAWNDDNTIVFTASEGVLSTIGSIDANGKNFKRRINSAPYAIRSMDPSEAGHIALVISKAQHPYELYILKKGEDTPERLSVTNGWLENRSLAKQEVVKWQARDGMGLEGILIRPLNEESGVRYPLITVVHGGPESHYDNGWLSYYSTPGQMAAANGYAVFYPNYRGSTGRGEEFAKSSQGDPAGKEFDDVVDGVDYLIEQGLVDKDKVGVTGGSYGGYATAWMSTYYTERFAAGVMSVGISDNISKWGTSDIPEEMFLVHSRKRIWDDYQFFLERSPIYYAGQAKTPLLIMHGKEDTRVNPGQSYEMYRHIKTRTETPVRLVLYPGEGHGNRKSTARFDYSLRLMRWFDTYLKGDESTMPETTIELK
jgi:dipeptidyl aminopeptidase/acylaminoacyl peptidase